MNQPLRFRGGHPSSRHLSGFTPLKYQEDRSASHPTVDRFPVYVLAQANLATAHLPERLMWNSSACLSEEVTERHRQTVYGQLKTLAVLLASFSERKC